MAEDTVDGAPSSPGVADPTQERTDTIRYPAWQPECRAVMLEIDPRKVKEKYAVAATAMAKRAAQLTTPDDDPECRALKEEGLALKLALDEIMAQHPDLNK